MYFATLKIPFISYAYHEVQAELLIIPPRIGVMVQSISYIKLKNENPPVQKYF